MQIQTPQQLTAKKCEPCEGGVEACPIEFSQEQLKNLDQWKLTEDKQRIFKTWTMKNFVHALNCFNQVGEVAESEAPHPDLHLQGYRNVRIEIWTHAIGGLSENDFILAAKIDEIEIK
jgi:4a-hydroxytetrahydrobiopterin dehydratase